MENKNTNYLNCKKGIMSWVYTLDHKRIGIMYLVSSVLALFAGGVYALLIRTQLLDSKGAIYTESTQYLDYNQLFTLHGIIMVFLFIIPAIPSALGNFVLPLMVGAKDVAFPRLNLLSYYVYVVGAIIALLAIFLGDLTTGWTLYTPYSISEGSTGLLLMLTAAFILGFASIFTGINFIATIHKLRAPGMTWFRMPLLLWSLYATSVLQVLATPVLGVTLLLLIMETSFNIGIFDPNTGGDPVLFQHFFWFYSHPAVYIMILPGMGIVSELISTFSKKTIFGYKAIALSSLSIALISFFVWGHHMYISGQTVFSNLIFSFLTFAVAIPSAIKVFNWVATLYKGSIKLDSPMCYALAFIVLFSIGGLTGLHLGTLNVNANLHDTYFVIAHFHYVMVGGTVIAFLGGVHFWWPKMFGKMYNELTAKIACLIIFISFNVTFLPQFVLGFLGMPRRYAQYDTTFQTIEELSYAKTLNITSSIGAYALGIGILLVFVNLTLSLFSKKNATDNPWNATTLDWQCQSPPVHENFTEDPVVTCDPYTYNKEAAHE